MIATASEGGADVYKLNYFDRYAFLAQSPQLYKQMALMADLGRVRPPRHRHSRRSRHSATQRDLVGC